MTDDVAELRRLLRAAAAHWSGDHKVVLEIFALQNVVTDEQRPGLERVIDLLMENMSGNGPLERLITQALGDARWSAYHPEWDRGVTPPAPLESDGIPNSYGLPVPPWAPRWPKGHPRGLLEPPSGVLYNGSRERSRERLRTDLEALGLGTDQIDALCTLTDSLVESVTLTFDEDQPQEAEGTDG